MATTQTAVIPLKTINAADLHKLPPAELLGKTHLVARGLNIIFGPSGCFKSFLAIGLALEVAQFPSVLYIAAEGSSGLNARVQAWCDYYKLAPGHLEFFCEELNLLEDAAADRIIATVKKFPVPPGLVICDTYARCMVGGDENSSKDAGKVVKNCAKIQRDLSCAVLLIHHTNKAGRDERGSNALRGAADMMIEVSAHDEQVRIECSKAKDFELWPDEQLRFTRHANSGLLLPSKQAASSAEMGHREIKVLEFLSLSIFEHPGATTMQICEGVGIPRNGTIYRLLSKLKDQGYIAQHKKGDPYTITDDGTIALHAANPETTAPPTLQIVVEDDDEKTYVS